MNVTESRFKNRQLHMEDYLQMVSAEQKEYAEVFDYSKITEKSGVITDYWTNNLLDLILRKDNLNGAYKQVRKNKGMLNELDKELEHRGHRFVRYADDCMIFCKSRKSAERTLKNIIPFIEGKLFLKVNRKKTEVAHISKVKYLGYTFYRYKGKCRFRVHPKSVTKMKNKIRELTDRNNGMSNAKREEKYQQFVRGWVNYFKLADMKKLLKEIDEWTRRRIRMVYWKQWKKIKTKYRMLKALGLEDWKAKE